MECNHIWRQECGTVVLNLFLKSWRYSCNNLLVKSSEIGGTLSNREPRLSKLIYSTIWCFFGMGQQNSNKKKYWTFYDLRLRLRAINRQQIVTKKGNNFASNWKFSKQILVIMLQIWEFCLKYENCSNKNAVLQWLSIIFESCFWE